MLIDLLKYLFDVFVPRFITEDVALVMDENGQYRIFCAMKDIIDNDEYDAVVSVSSFTWLGFGFFPQVKGEIRVK